MTRRKADPKGLTYEAAGKRLKLSKQRISQLRAQGELPSLAPEALSAFELDRRAKAKAKADYWAARNAAMLERDKREFAFWDALLERLDSINRSLTLIATVNAASTVAANAPKKGIQK